MIVVIPLLAALLHVELVAPLVNRTMSIWQSRADCTGKCTVRKEAQIAFAHLSRVMEDSIDRKGWHNIATVATAGFPWNTGQIPA